jgi:hypothetical protein
MHVGTSPEDQVPSSTSTSQTKTFTPYQMMRFSVMLSLQQLPQLREQDQGSIIRIFTDTEVSSV